MFVQKFGALRQSVAAKAASVSALVLVAPAVMAQGAGSDPFETALADATTKVGTYAAALVGLAAVAVIFMIAVKYVKKIPRAS